ncbi:unnamed protein product [Rotaria socialis]|uniref:Kinesin light chain n=4 Tax=Rotaria socialis TaxID=392032 RepID=A0A819AUC8_9BILA|nr:unnamed protein product [Rotaria socialis]CAF4698152.1 unnamed protein product [Rotaria socialis]
MASKISASNSRDLQPVETLKNKENTRLIWLDGNIDDSKDSMHTQNLLLEFNPAAQFYTDSTRCVDFVKSIQGEQILLIISGALARDVLPQISRVRSVIAVFIFCRNREFHVKLMSEYSKIVDIFIVQDELLRLLRDTMTIVEKQAFTFSLFDQTQKSTRDLSKDSASFLWNQLLLYVLKKMPQDDQAKNEMLTTCSNYYAMNKKELNKIEQFRKSYSREQAIKWYTDECFLYKLLNNAIRTEDIDLLYAFRFYIIDLCHALEKESEQLKTGGVLKLYRGQHIPNGEFEKLRKATGTLISTNGFLSTSRSIDVALGFIRQLPVNDDMKLCIFEINADPNVTAVVFADIDKYSKMQGEQEVLFGLNSTFKIDHVKMEKKLNVWKIGLSTTAEGSTRIEQYMKLQEDQLQLISPLVSFGCLLLNELGQIERAKCYFSKLLHSLPSDHPDISSIQNNLGNVYSAKDELNLALKYYEEAYRKRRSTLSENHPLVASSLNNIGLIYKNKGDFDRALDYLHQSLAIDEKNYPGDHSSKALYLENIGLTYQSKGDIDSALAWFKRAFGMYTRVLPAPHPYIASALGNLGSVYEKKGDLDRAIDFYRQRLEMAEECLPPGHPDLSSYLNRVAQTYKKKNDKKTSLMFCEKQLASQKTILGDKHPRIASTLMTIGDICEGEETRRYYEEALSVLENCTPCSELTLIDCLTMLGAIALDDERLEDGIAHWKYVLDVRRRIHSSDHPAIAEQLQRLGEAYFEAMHNYPEAFRYFSESLAIYRANYGDQHKDVIEVKEYLRQVKEKMADS